MKKLAYPIQFKNEGYYVLTTFNAEANAVAVITNTLNITDNIVRQMIIKK